MSTICLVAAIVLYVIAGLAYAGLFTVDSFDVFALVCFGLAFHAASHLPWADWRVR